MDNVSGLLTGLLVIAGLVYVIFLRPRFEDKRDALIFDNRVIAVIDGLYLSGMKFGCTDFEMRSYARRLLKKAHSIPDNQTLLSHTIVAPDRPNIDGWTFDSHTGIYGDHIVFALLCLIEYGKETGHQNLITQCEQLLLDARQMKIHY